MTQERISQPGATARPRLGAPPRRRSRRDRVTCLVWLEPMGGGRGSGVARAVDLSPRGVGVVIPHALPLDAEVLVELLVPPTRLRLRTTGRVVHAQQIDDDQHRVGVRFEHPPVLVDHGDA